MINNCNEIMLHRLGSSIFISHRRIYIEVMFYKSYIKLFIIH